MEFTTQSEFPNEFPDKRKYEGRGVVAIEKMQFMRDRVAQDLRELRKSYYNCEYRRFAELCRRITGYFFLNMISDRAYHRARIMMFQRGLICND